MHPSLSHSFYERLAYTISHTLSGSSDKSRRRYWCDGILDPEWAEDHQPEHVRRTRQLRLRAWIDQGSGEGSAQSVWELVLKLGPQSYRAYLQGRSLEALVPTPADDEWLLIDPDNQLLEVQLH